MRSPTPALQSVAQPGHGQVRQAQAVWSIGNLRRLKYLYVKQNKLSGALPEELGQAAKVIAENRKRGVVVQAWSPLGKALRGTAREACAEIGRKYGKSAAQVALKWILSHNATVATQSTSAVHLQQDVALFVMQFEAMRESTARIAAGEDPDEVNESMSAPPGANRALRRAAKAKKKKSKSKM